MGQNPCGVLATGAFVAEWANTVLLAPTATDTTNDATNAIFLSITAPCGLVVGFC
jgi:peptidoglycan biosynthesis protein MviN/MurJ (putative lipid II flippase)